MSPFFWVNACWKPFWENVSSNETAITVMPKSPKSFGAKRRAKITVLTRRNEWSTTRKENSQKVPWTVFFAMLPPEENTFLKIVFNNRKFIQLYLLRMTWYRCTGDAR